ncbi:short-chain specific acyl-CoA dehydrogenase mitochondrial precursor [Cryphonectria parasitica EP155]|uniref:Short-chain specific acyl-CoA dehydrogenase mitochondrial n=1 Tax=Cryphonectria parasitica (strain ATCC 38755 / EP155) TaxID=660469 RepID=A0A9P4Y6G9_CRYP1|nr:short-chain specific acyl-CoA dehydrogenase mitochondrial precursor [Cryphonectria parasitica EP155]KAF3767339.1 short-chain specific acyl-CoA dehydrogenase mitochondrial precursor [Cryphonectria parasitica EP155]
MADNTSAPVPFSEPPWLMGLPSPIFKPTHVHWQRTIRAFIDEHLTPHAIEWDKAGLVPDHVFETFARANMLLPALAPPLPADWLHRLGIHELPGGLKVEDYDYLHGLIFCDEMNRCGLVGPGASLTTGMAFGVPPLIKFGSPQLQERFLPELLTGKKRSCIAITEPDAGSDVAGITTTATKTEGGESFVVNGTKKWITNGIWTDYATMAVRTGEEGSGPKGLSLLVVPLKNYPGVRMRRLKVGGQVSAGTTYIELDNVEVPAGNLIGEEGMGMKYIMTNFNHERLTIAVGATRQARVALSSAFEYVLKREAFGRPLMDQPVVRHRLAKAGALLESQWAWVEQFAYQLTQMKKEDSDIALGGLTGLLKANSGMVLKECADTAVLLFGGNGFTTSGQGELIEMLWREVPGIRIPGGSEDVLLDLAIRQLVKLYKAKTAAIRITKL